MNRLVISMLALSVAFGSAAANSAEHKLTKQQKRFIKAFLTAPKSAPGIGLGVPAGFGASEGLAFASIGGTTSENAVGDSDYDGSASVGIGFGDPNTMVGIELQANIISLTDNGPDSGFGEQGSTSIKLSRTINTTSGVAFGIENASTWGSNLDTTDPTVYVAYSTVSALSSDPFNPLTLSLTAGVGNERFRDFSNGEEKNSIGFFGSAALAVHRQVGVIMDFNGNYFSTGVSFVPMVKQPVTVTLSLVNINSVDAADGGTATGDVEFGGSVGYSWSF